MKCAASPFVCENVLSVDDVYNECAVNTYMHYLFIFGSFSIDQPNLLQQPCILYSNSANIILFTS